jgi:hypothetical protein
MILDMRSSELGKDSKNGCACISIYINLFLALKPNGDVRLCAWS